MLNPFEDDRSRFVILVNHEGQHSLWPHSIQTPPGWATAFGPETRQACVDYVETHWVDMRPKSLIDAMEASVG